MPLEYTAHARSRMRERGFTEGEVEEAVNRCDGGPEPGNRPGTLVYRGAKIRPDGKRLKVVVDAAVRNRVVSVMSEETVR